MGVMQSLRHDVTFLDCIPQIGASAFLFWPAAGASLSSRFKQTVNAKNAFTVCLPALVKANGHLSLFFSGQLQGLAPRVASEFRERQRTPFQEILPAPVGPHDAGHAVVATRCRELRLPSPSRRFRFSFSVPFFLGIWLFDVV